MTDTPTDRETVEDLIDSLRSEWLVTDVVPDTMAALLARAEAAEAEVERLREPLSWIGKTIEKNITPNDLDKHRLLLDGEWHTGPVVDWVHSVLTGIMKITRAALKDGGEDA